MKKTFFLFLIGASVFIKSQNKVANAMANELNSLWVDYRESRDVNVTAVRINGFDLQRENPNWKYQDDQDDMSEWQRRMSKTERWMLPGTKIKGTDTDAPIIIECDVNGSTHTFKWNRGQSNLWYTAASIRLEQNGSGIKSVSHHI